jgi:hypothetical protein
MIGGLAMICVILGAALAFAADRYPRQAAMMETVAGFLLIGGFALLGYALECVFGPF